MDSDFANEAERRRSTYGYVFKAGNSVISWKSKRNSTVTKSTMEAELAGAGEAVKEALHLMWIRHFMDGNAPCVPISTDSRAAYTVIKNPHLEDNRKHIEVIYHHVREREAAGLVEFQWIPGRDNVADVFTKPLPRPAFDKCCAELAVL